MYVYTLCSFLLKKLYPSELYYVPKTGRLLIHYAIIESYQLCAFCSYPTRKAGYEQRDKYMKKIKLGGHKKGSVIRGYALVDNRYYEELNKVNWHLQNGRYAGRIEKIDGKQKVVLMHAFLLKTPKGMQTDHIDGNGLNNQQKNLRICTASQNQMNTGKRKTNTSGFKGVSWDKRNKKWRANIKINGKKIHLGCFDDKLFAYAAYCEACIKYHGEFANLD